MTEERPPTVNDRHKRAREIAHRYSDQERERGLFAVALASGNCERAATSLAQVDPTCAPDARTLQRWKAQDLELYARIEGEALPQVRAELAGEFADLTLLELDVARKLLARLDAEADELAPRDLAGALRNVKVAGAVGVDKAQLLRGQPTEIQRTESLDELLRRAERHGAKVEYDTDATAVDVTDESQDT